MQTLTRLWEGSSWNQRIAYVLGATYVLTGLVGFAVTGLSGFAATEGDELIIFGLNPLHNLVHIAVGGLLLGGAWATAQASRGVNLLVGGVYAVVGVAGFFVINSDLNILAINHADNGLHLGSALVLLAVGILFGADGVRGATGSDVETGEGPRPVTGHVGGADRRTKGELYERAQELDVEGRSGMDKDQLRVAIHRQQTPSNGERRTAGLTTGDNVPATGTYRCSCKDFAVFVREGYRFPQCPVGEGHIYTLTSRRTERSGQRV